MEQTLSIKGMSCQNCVRHVKEALEEISGVQKAEVDLEANKARIETDSPLTQEQLSKVLEDAGYTLEAIN